MINYILDVLDSFHRIYTTDEIENVYMFPEVQLYQIVTKRGICTFHYRNGEFVYWYDYLTDE